MLSFLIHNNSHKKISFITAQFQLYKTLFASNILTVFKIQTFIFCFNLRRLLLLFLSYARNTLTVITKDVIYNNLI